jgi:hypothetical protein
VIENNGDFARVPDLGFQAGILVNFFELIDDQGAVFMRHGHVHLGFQHISRFDRGLVRGPGQDLFNHCHSHDDSSLWVALRSRLFP